MSEGKTYNETLKKIHNEMFKRFLNDDFSYLTSRLRSMSHGIGDKLIIINFSFSLVKRVRHIPRIEDKIVGAIHKSKFNLGRALFEAVHQDEPCNIDFMQRLLSLGADMETTDKYGRTPLVSASTRGPYSSFYFLLDKGAQVNTKNAAIRDRLGNDPVKSMIDHFSSELDIYIAILKAGYSSDLTENNYSGLINALNKRGLPETALKIKSYVNSISASSQSAGLLNHNRRKRISV